MSASSWGRRLLPLCLILLVAPAASAQFAIHGHPQKATYASPAEWLAVDSQCWIGNPDPLQAGHIHVVPKAPAYAQITDYAPFDVPITIKAHKIAGIVGLVRGEHVRRIVWDATGTEELPVMRGNPDGLVEWTGVATVDLTLGDDGPGGLHIFLTPLHGWLEVRIFTRTVLDDGSQLDASAVFPLYSAIDLSAPEKPAAEQGNPGVHHRAACVFSDPSGTAIAGEVITEIDNYLPLVPITVLYPTIANVYNYTAPAGVALTSELFEQRLDPDLHHGVMGSLIRQDVIPPELNKQLVTPIVLDPAVMGTGAHKAMVVWTQPFPTQAVSAVIVFPVTVGTGVPVPTTCTDPTATNVGGLLPCIFPPPPVLICNDPAALNDGGPLPCVYNPPPPAPVWTTFDAIVQRFGTEDRYRICDTVTHCVEIVIR